MEEKDEQQDVQKFEIIFEHWGEGNVGSTCDFCKLEEAAWYCDFLVEGYCEACMRDQKNEYFEKNFANRVQGKR